MNCWLFDFKWYTVRAIVLPKHLLCPLIYSHLSIWFVTKVKTIRFSLYTYHLNSWNCRWHPIRFTFLQCVYAIVFVTNNFHSLYRIRCITSFNWMCVKRCCLHFFLASKLMYTEYFFATINYLVFFFSWSHTKRNQMWNEVWQLGQ